MAKLSIPPTQGHKKISGIMARFFAPIAMVSIGLGSPHHHDAAATALAPKSDFEP
jgi:hypothetical protein